MRKPIAILAIIFIATASLSVSMAEEIAPTTRGTEVNLDLFCGQHAEELDFYYTFEEDNPHSAVNETSIDEDLPVKDIDSLVKTINEKCPGVLAMRNKHNPAVIHLIDRSLLMDKNYPLERKISIRFDGSPDGLVNAIGKTIPSVRHADDLPYSMMSMIDPFTSIHVDARDDTVRDVLTNWLPLSDYRVVPWNAEKRQGKDGRDYIGVSHCGRPPLPHVEELLPFSFGWSAYVSNPTTPEEQDKAMKFIREKLQKHDPLHIRWAMLFFRTVPGGTVHWVAARQYRFPICHRRRVGGIVPGG